MSASFVAAITECNVVVAKSSLFVTRARVLRINGSIPVTNRDKPDISHRHITGNLGSMKITAAPSA
jgi:hypothetical protein